MDFQSFLNKYNGAQNVGNTSENKGQCVGLVMVWLKDTLKLPHVWGHAKDLLANADPNSYEVIYNSPLGVPQKGDVVVWKQSFNGTFGHTAIATGSGNIFNFEVFEQNNPLGSNCHLAKYNYNHVAGWLRPRKQPEPQICIDAKKFEELVSKSSKYDEFAKLGLSIDEVKKLKDHKCSSFKDQANKIIEIAKTIG